MKTVSVITTWPASGRFDYSVLLNGQPWREGLTAGYVPADLTAEQRAVLEAAQAVLEAVAAAEGPTLSPGQSLVLVTTKPQLNQIECAVVAGGQTVQHGLVIGFNPLALSAPDRADLLAARTLLAELAAADAQAQGLL